MPIDTTLQFKRVLEYETKSTFTNIRFIFIFLLTLVLSIFTTYAALTATDVSVRDVITSTVLFSFIIVYLPAIVLVPPILSSEYEDKSFLFIASKPYSRTKYLFTKAASIIFLQLIVLLIYFIGGAFASIYHLNYIPEHLIVYFLLIALAIFAFTGISTLISTVTNSSAASVITSLILIILMGYLVQYSTDVSFLSYLPTSIVNDISFGNGNFSPDVSWETFMSHSLTAAFALIITGTVSFIIANYAYSRREM